MSTSKLIAITGITGKQGNAVAKMLLKSGHKIRGLTRNITSPGAIKLAEQGVELVKADMEDLESLKVAFTGVDSVFLMTTPTLFTAKNEVKQGKSAAEAAKFAGVSHLVYTSVGNSENAPSVPHFASKYAVELYIRDELKLPYTIIRPAFFMENYASNSPTAPAKGILKGFIPEEYKLQMVAVEDIGKVAAIALDNRDKYLGRTIELSGDELNGSEMASVLSKVTGERYSYKYWWFYRYVLQHILRDMGAMTDFFMKTGYNTNVPKLREEFPDLQTWETWLTKNGYAKYKN